MNKCGRLLLQIVQTRRLIALAGSRGSRRRRKAIVVFAPRSRVIRLPGKYTNDFAAKSLSDAPRIRIHTSELSA